MLLNYEDEETMLARVAMQKLTRVQLESLMRRARVIDQALLEDTDEMRQVLVQLVVDRVVPLEWLEEYETS